MLCWWIALAWAQDPSVVAVRDVEVPPEDVYRIVADLGLWERFWTAQRPGGPEAGRAVRGRPLAPHQDLRWSEGPAGSGQILVHAVEAPRQVIYEMTWTRRPVVEQVLGGLPDHVGNVRVDAREGGSTVTWELYPAGPTDGGWAVKRATREIDATLARLGAAVAEAGSLPPPPPEPPGAERRDGVLVWRGFHHRWTYNHRINRNGDAWTPPECGAEGCAATALHAAASGSGADRATWDSAATVLTGPGLAGWYGEIVLWFDGREGDALADRGCAKLPAEVGDGPALLRGWDLDAIGDADSLWAFEVAVERKGGEVCATGGLRMACRTPECRSGTRTTYSLDVPFVVATGDVQLATHRIERVQTWEARDLRDEPDPAKERVALEFSTDPARPVALGLSGVSVALDKPLHTRGLDVAVGPVSRDASGAARAALDLFVVQWGPVEIAPLTVAQFAEAGTAELAADVVVLQPAKGCAVDLAAGGDHFWGGQSEDASVDAAVARRDVAFTPCR